MKSRSVRIFFIIAVAALLMKSSVSAAVYFWPKPEIESSGNAAAFELIRLTNEYRQKLGLGALAINPRLTQAAVNKAKDILSHQYFSHTSPEGRKFSDWVKDVNYAYFYVGENLAIDFPNSQEAFDAWLGSPKHKENIERSEYQEIGIADLKGEFEGRETNVIVQLFGSRVLGADEQSSGAAAGQAGNYFTPADDSSGYGYFGLVDQYLNYILFAAILLLVLAVIVHRMRRKKSPSGRTAAFNTSSAGIMRVSAKKQAPPLISLYTKRTLTANARPDTSGNISQPGSRKPGKTRSPKPKPSN